MEYFINRSCSACKHRFPFHFVPFKAAGSSLPFPSNSHWPTKPKRGESVVPRAGSCSQAGRREAQRWLGGFIPVLTVLTAWLCSDPRLGGPSQRGDAECNVGQGFAWAWGAVRAEKEPEPSPGPKSRGSPTALRVVFRNHSGNCLWFLAATAPEPHSVHVPWHVPRCAVLRSP